MRAVNLIPAEQRSGGAVASRSEGAAFVVLGLIAGLAILTLLYGIADHQVSTRHAEAASLNTQAQRVQAQASRLTSYTSFVSMREQRLQSIAQLVGSRFDWAATLGELSRVLPRGVSLSSLQGLVGSTTGSGSTGKASGSSSSSSSSSTTGASAASAVSSATPPGTIPSITLTGCTTSQAAVAQMLVRLRLISGVTGVELKSSTKSTSGSVGGGGTGGAGSCLSGFPVFTVVVSFNPLPHPPTSSIQALEASAGTHPGRTHSEGGRSVVSSTSTGAKR